MEKGFSLIELLVVISILAIIALISVPAVTSVINDSKEKAYKEQEKSIIDAAKTYMINNSLKLPTAIDQTYCVTVSELKQTGLLKNEKIINSLYNNKTNTIIEETDDEFNGGVLVSYNGVKYSYNYKDSC